MKVALVLSGLPRKVEEGYNQYWKHILDRYDVDLYLHAWQDEEWKDVLRVYNDPKVALIEKPFSFKQYREDVVSPGDDMSRPTMPYDVSGNFRGLPMFYSWQKIWKLVSAAGGEYDCIIRSRYDLGAATILDLESLDMEKINITNAHWPNSEITDDNLCITNTALANILFHNCFDDVVKHIKSTGVIHFQEKNFMQLLQRKNLYHLVHKSNNLPFQLLRDNKLWY